jgi:alcohol dehydrogenase class IV
MSYDQIFAPTKVLFGNESLTYLKEIKQQYNHIFIIASKSLNEHLREEINAFLGDSLELFRQGDLSGEPTEENINFLLSQKTENTDCIIGIGGGSYLDAAKVLAIQEDKLSNFDDESSKVLPIVAIPTTAGTGSETSRGSVIKCNGIKKGIRSNKFLPKVAIIDPRLCESLPLNLTLYTGFDALTHAVETFMSKKSNTFTRLLSEKSVKLLFTYLPLAKKEFTEFGKISLKTREKLSYAAMLQGFNLANASTCIPHRMQYALSTVSNATHPQGLAAIFRAWLKCSQPIIAGYNYKDIIQLMDNLRINFTLKDLGIYEEHFEKILSNLSSGLEVDPCYENESTLRKILEESLS